MSPRSTTASSTCWPTYKASTDPRCASATTKAAPNDPRYHLNLAVILMAAGKLDAARSEIAATKGLDRFNVLADEIRGYESRLAGMARGG